MTVNDLRCPCCDGTDCREHIGRLSALACGSCGHVWRGTRAVSPDYAKQRMRTVQRNDHVIRRIAERLEFIGNVAPTARVLEVGCAEGHLGAALRQRWPMIRLIGIEPSEDAAVASQIFDSMHRVHLLDADLDCAPFDLVMAFHVLEHIQDPYEACRWLVSVLDSEGRLIIEIPHGSGHRWVPEDCNPEHLHFFTLSSVSCLLYRTGAEVRIARSGGFESPLYSDSLRVEAVRQVTRDAKAVHIRKRLQEMLIPGGAVWGLGGDFETYVRPYLPSKDSVVLVDSSPRTQETEIDGRRVRDPRTLGDAADRHVLIASYRYEAQIRRSALALGILPDRLHSLEELLR